MNRRYDVEEFMKKIARESVAFIEFAGCMMAADLPRRLLAVTAISLALLAFGSHANAETAVGKKVADRLAAASEKLKAACGEDLNKYCSSVTPGEGRLIFCLMAHEDKIGEKCDYALYDASRKMEHSLDLIEDAADACWGDIEKHCAKGPVGGGRIAQCLLDNKKSLRAACQTAIEKFPAAK
jgi:Golgi apparatus protein 1